MANITVPGLPAKTGTILDAAYLHLNESSIDKKVTIAQLLAKIEAQYSADIVTFLGSANKAEGRANLSIDRRVTVDDANYTILATDKVVAQIGTMSTARTFSLPAASTVEAGAEIIVIDESGSVDSTNKITVQRNGTDTIDGLTQVDITKSYGSLKLICDGSNSWKISNNIFSINPVGSIITFAKNSSPVGFLECDGSAISRTTYNSLFSVIGTIFGVGDGSTTFNIPDLRGEFIRGWDNSRGVDSGRTFGSFQDHAIEDHTHFVGSGLGDSVSGGERYAGNVAQDSGGVRGANVAAETRPRNIALMYCIKY